MGFEVKPKGELVGENIRGKLDRNALSRIGGEGRLCADNVEIQILAVQIGL